MSQVIPKRFKLLYPILTTSSNSTAKKNTINSHYRGTSRFIILGAALTCAFSGLSLIAAPKTENFKVEVLAEGFTDPQEMVMLPDGKILVCEIAGSLRLWDPHTGELRLAGKLEVAVRKDAGYARECGFIGITIDPNFKKNKWLYAYYSNPTESYHQLSRFTLTDNKLDPSTEVKILKVPTERTDKTCHEGGSLAFGPDGLLYLSTGDNTNPFSKPATPIEEDIKERDAQRSASNSNDLRGKILRIKVNPDGSYSIPKGNLFPNGTKKTRPEIYAMGLRNPYRITLNSKTGTLYWSDIAPDKNPTGEEINQAKTAGYYGWPYVITDTKVFNDLHGKPFDPENLENTSKNNTGITALPVPREPLHFYNRSCSIIGGVYHHVDAAGAFPAHFDNCLLFADWNGSWLKFIRLDKDENNVGIENFKLNFKMRKPIDIFFDKGVLYILEYGNGWYNNKDGRLLKISYSEDFNQQSTETNDQRIIGMNHKLPGIKIMQSTTCFSCHHSQNKIIGPSFGEIAEKYKNDKDALSLLTQKVKIGSVGVWGQQPMPAHKMHPDKQIQEMIKAVLSTEKIGGHEE